MEAAQDEDFPAVMVRTAVPNFDFGQYPFVEGDIEQDCENEYCVKDCSEWHHVSKRLPQEEPPAVPITDFGQCPLVEGDNEHDRELEYAVKDCSERHHGPKRLPQEEAIYQEEFQALTDRTELAEEEDLEDTTPLEMVRKKRRSC